MNACPSDIEASRVEKMSNLASPQEMAEAMKIIMMSCINVIGREY